MTKPTAITFTAAEIAELAEAAKQVAADSLGRQFSDHQLICVADCLVARLEIAAHEIGDTRP